MESSLLLLLLLFVFAIFFSSLPIHSSNQILQQVPTTDQPNGFFLPFESNLYLQISIGTPPQPFNFKLDSTTHLTYLQCSLSTSKSSTTFSTISCNNSSLCPQQHINSLSLFCTPSDFCRYDLVSSSGYLVSDTLQLTSSILDQENSVSIVHGFVFGCGTSNRVVPGETDDGVDGRVSLSMHRFSILSQLRVTRFSHCLWSASAGSRNYIRLGSVAEFGGEMKMVPMLNVTDSFSYHIALLGITLGPQRMGSNNGSNNTVEVDIGRYYTRLETSLYEEVKQELMLQIGPTVSYEAKGLMCFTMDGDLAIDSLPKLTLHFEGFDYTISNKGLYLEDGTSSLCTALFRSSVNVLGASALVDFAVSYDISQRKLAFQQKDCLADFVDGM